MGKPWTYWVKKALKYPLLWALNLSVAEVETWQRAPGFHLPGRPADGDGYPGPPPRRNGPFWS
jgi:hypothetical protein